MLIKPSGMTYVKPRCRNIEVLNFQRTLETPKQLITLLQSRKGSITFLHNLKRFYWAVWSKNQEVSICAPKLSMFLSLIFRSCAVRHRRISWYMGKYFGSGITLRAVARLSSNSNGYHNLGTQSPVSLSVPTVAMAVFLKGVLFLSGLNHVRIHSRSRDDDEMFAHIALVTNEIIRSSSRLKNVERLRRD